ncbi:ankyrin repeat domain-containing protein SOWAHA-like [Oncorhynchus clarkii lewisi]|uniref:ankyrin repeat domain-containing protein SOWAHA-like n=1 Tax=Oncorhynchus clarkii lewisi TaxID=490388 RepID=UPI0039B90923
MALTQETILTFLLEHGGKVKNSDLLNHFKPQINCSDPAEKKHNRDLFKTIINSVAVVKQIDDVKFVVVKKRFHDFVKGGKHFTTEKSDLDESICSQNTSFPPSSSEHCEYSAISKSGRILNSDIENNNSCCASSIHGNCLNDIVKHMPLHINELGGRSNVHPAGYGGAVRSSNLIKTTYQETPTIKILNVSADQGIRKTTGPVFAIVAVKCPPQSQREDPVLMRQDGSNNKVSVGPKTSEIPSMLAKRPPTPLPPEAAVTPKPPGRVSSEWGTGTYTSPGAKIRHPELGETPSASPQLRRTQNKHPKQGDNVKDVNKYSESQSPQLRRTQNKHPKQGDNVKDANKYSESQSPQLRRTQNKHLKQGDDTTNDLTTAANKVTAKDANKYSDQSIPLEAAAHEWLVKSAAGLWGHVYSLLLQDPQLAEKKDFISGFTALHWAAKGGNTDMVRNILDISRKRGTEVDVNSRTQAGYTPLHIAVIHGHDGVITLLVRDYGASVNIRDNDGKKSYHYLEKGVSSELRELLGDPQVSQQDRCQDKQEDEEDRELPRGLNTLSRLMGHRKRNKNHAAEDTEDDRKDGPQSYHRRHFSDMFYHH